MGKRSRSSTTTTTTSLWVLASLFLFTCFWAAFWSPRSPFSGTASTASPGVETSADFNEVNEKTEAPPTTPAFGSLTLLCARDDRQCPGPSNLTQISPSSSKQIKAICFKGFGFLGGGDDHLEDQVQCYKVAGSEDKNCSGNGHLTTANASVSDGLLPKVVNSEAIGGNSSQQKESGNQSTSLPSMNGPASNSRLRALMYTCAPKKFTNSSTGNAPKKQSWWWWTMQSSSLTGWALILFVLALEAAVVLLIATVACYCCARYSCCWKGKKEGAASDPEWDEPWNYRFLVSYRGRWIDPHDQSFTIWKVYVGGREGGGFVGDRRVPMDIGVAGLPLRVAEVDGEGDRYHPGGHGLSRRFHSRGFRGVVGGGSFDNPAFEVGDHPHHHLRHPRPHSRPRNQTPHPRRGVSGAPRTAPLPPLTSAPDYEDDVPGGRSVVGYPPQNVITTAPPPLPLQSNDIGLNIINELPTERSAFQLILTVIHEDEGGEGVAAEGGVDHAHQVSQASAGCPPAPPPSAHTSPTATTTTATTASSPPPPYSAVTKYAAKKWVKKVAEV